MAGLNLPPLALSAAGNALASVPSEQAGLQLQQAQTQSAQQGVMQQQRQAAEMQGLQRASKEATDRDTGQIDQDKFIGLVGQYAPSHLAPLMQAGGMYAYRQSMVDKNTAQTGLYGANQAKSEAQTSGLNFKNQDMADTMVSKVAQAALNMKKPDGTPDMDARQNFINQNMPALQRAGINPDDIKGIPLNDENLKAYVDRGLSGHDYVGLYMKASSEIGKVDQDEKNNMVSHEWADKERKKLTDIKAGTSFGPGGTPTLTPAAMDAMVENYHLYGSESFKYLGNRFVSNIGPEIMNGEAKKYGLASRDWQGNMINLRATYSSLTQTQKTRDAVVAFEKVAQQNGQAALNILKKVADVGSPLLNQPIRSVMDKLGDADVHALDAQLDVFSKEVARITSNPSLSGVLTDSERKDLRSMVSKDITVGQFQKLMEVYGADMERRKNSLDALLAEQKGRVPKINPQTPATPGSSPATAAKVMSLEDYLKANGH